LHPGRSLDEPAAAAVTGLDPVDAGRLLDHLTRAHLVRRGRSGRYTMHELLHAYAADLAAREDTEAARDAALDRLLDHYLAAASTAAAVLHPEGTEPPGAGPVTPAAATDWLGAELANLVATSHYAVTRRPRYAIQLARVLTRPLTGNHYRDALVLHGNALAAATRIGDTAAAAQTLNQIGIGHRLLGRPAAATEHHLQALELFRAAGDRPGEAKTHSLLCASYMRENRYELAAEHGELGLAVSQELGDRHAEGAALINVGFVYETLGRLDQALVNYQRSLAIDLERGDRADEAISLVRLCSVQRKRGRLAEAAEHGERALALFGESGDQGGRAFALNRLGDVDVLLGRPARAVERHRRALAMFRVIGSRDGESSALLCLGEALVALGDHDAALAELTAAHDAAAGYGIRVTHAHTHARIGDLHSTRGDDRQAAPHWRRALALYREIGLPDAAGMAERLARTARSAE
jgi:tetratricopeptide (TPR) repeat protein